MYAYIYVSMDSNLKSFALSKPNFQATILKIEYSQIQNNENVFFW